MTADFKIYSLPILAALDVSSTEIHKRVQLVRPASD